MVKRIAVLIVAAIMALAMAAPAWAMHGNGEANGACQRDDNGGKAAEVIDTDTGPTSKKAAEKYWSICRAQIENTKNGASEAGHAEGGGR